MAHVSLVAQEYGNVNKAFHIDTIIWTYTQGVVPGWTDADMCGLFTFHC